MVEARKLVDQYDVPAIERRNTSFAMRKVVIVGDAGVGKTAILSRFVNG
jgi:GTPase SAR1 family protein